MRYILSSKYFRIFCVSTGREEIFNTERECIEWANKMASRFQGQYHYMTFTVTEITEKKSVLNLKIS